MPINTKTIKRRLKSISSTKKITKAMEMMAAVKMRKAVAQVAATRSYAKFAWQMLADIAGKVDVTLHPLLAKREMKKIGLIFITSNRGLAGGFNSRLLTAVNNYIKDSSVPVEVILMGKRGQKIYQRFGHQVAAEFEKIDLTTSLQQIQSMVNMVLNDYHQGKYDRLVVAYTDFISPIKQVATIKQLLPIVEETNVQPEKNLDFKFEPDIKEVLNILLPRLVTMQIYQAVLESDASEHSARMMAMRNASDAADDMITELNYTYNKARQAAITQEIAEIVGGVAALG